MSLKLDADDPQQNVGVAGEETPRGGEEEDGRPPLGVGVKADGSLKNKKAPTRSSLTRSNQLYCHFQDKMVESDVCVSHIGSTK